jgi:hypothetical protein
MADTFVSLLRAGVMAGLAAFLSVVAAAPCFADCFPPGQGPKATAAEMQASLADLLKGDAEKNATAIISAVRDLAASDPGALSFILTKLAGASDAQRSSIGTGLGQAATICQRTDVVYATDIQTQLLAADKSINNQSAETAFALTTGQTPIGAVGGGAAGGGGGAVSSGASGGQTTAFVTPAFSGTSTFQSLGTYGTPSQIGVITFGGNGSTSAPSRTTTIVRSVSAP